MDNSNNCSTVISEYSAFGIEIISHVNLENYIDLAEFKNSSDKNALILLFMRTFHEHKLFCQQTTCIFLQKGAKIQVNNFDFLKLFNFKIEIEKYTDFPMKYISPYQPRTVKRLGYETVIYDETTQIEFSMCACVDFPVSIR